MAKRKRWVSLSEVVRNVNERQEHRQTAHQALSVAESLVREIVDHVMEGRDVYVPGLGVFYRRVHKARRVRNVRDGEWLNLPETVGVGLRSSSSVKRGGR